MTTSSWHIRELLRKQSEYQEQRSALLHVGAWGIRPSTGRSRSDRIHNKNVLQEAYHVAEDVIGSLGLDRAFLVLPDGSCEYEVEDTDEVILDNSEASTYCAGLQIKAPVYVVGAGRGASKMIWYPTGTAGGGGPGFNWYAFHVDETTTSRDVDFQDFEIQGDLTTRADRANDWNDVDTGAFLIEGRTINTGFTFNARFKRIVASGKWNAVIRGTQSRGTLDIEDFDFSAYQAPVFWFPGDTDGGHLRARNGRIVSGGSSAGDSVNVGIYVHPSVSTKIEGVRFYDTARYGLYSNGNPDTAPEYNEVTNCYFDSSCAFGIQTNKNVPTIVTGTRFKCDSRALFLQHGASVSGSRFEAGTDFIVTSFAEDRSVNFDGCTFEMDSAVVSAGIAADAGRWTIANSVVRSSVSSVLARFTGGCSARVSNVEFIQSAGASWSTVAITPSSGLNVEFNQCRFGSGTGPDINGNGAFSNMAIRFRGCRFDGTGVQGDLQQANMVATAAGTVSGEDNQWAGSGMSLASSNASYYSRFAPRKHRNPSNVAAGTSVTLSPNYDYHVMTGTATVQNLYMLSASLAVTRQFDGEVTIEASGTGITLDGAGGNIRLTGGAASRALGDGEKVVLRFDPVSELVKEL